jgi:hypothetical protein
MGEWRQTAALQSVFRDAYMEQSSPFDSWAEGERRALEPIVKQKAEALWGLLSEGDARALVARLDLLLRIRKRMPDT